MQILFWTDIYLLIGCLLALYPFLTDSIGGGYDGEGRCNVCGFIIVAIMWPIVLWGYIYGEFFYKPTREKQGL